MNREETDMRLTNRHRELTPEEK